MSLLFYLSIFLILSMLFCAPTKVHHKIKMMVLNIQNETHKTEEKHKIRNAMKKLKKYHWSDFHKDSGIRKYSPGTLPTFGLYKNKFNLRRGGCDGVKHEEQFHSPCDLPYPAKCVDVGGGYKKCEIKHQYL